MGLALTSVLPGCVAHASGELVADYPAEYVETVPVRIEYYPRTYYRGNPAYLVEGRWYYRTHDRWAVFRDEPVELRNYRVRHAPAYLGPSNRYYGRSHERQIAERRGREREDARRFEARREAERRAEQRRHEQRREAERRAEDARRHDRREAQRAQEHRRDEQRREAQRADERRRLEEHRDAERRADQDSRVAERRGKAKRKRDREHGDQKESREERDRRRYRQD